jgi:hypothetical protein
MLWISVVGVLAGVWCLVAPPRAMLFGSRWQVRDGDRAEPSDLLIRYTRVSGVILIVLSVGFGFWGFTAQRQAEARESLQDAWDIGIFSSYGDLQIDLDPDVEPTTSAAGVMSRSTGEQQGLPAWQAKVVGRDDLGELGGDLADGDVVVAVRQGSCQPGTVFVEEGADEVSVAVTGVSTIRFQGAPLRCGTSNPLTKPDADELRIVHVPLSAPLGDRELVLPDPPARD